jgi:spore coat polysaccharide biosynthesis protein SpsF
LFIKLHADQYFLSALQSGSLRSSKILTSSQLKKDRKVVATIEARMTSTRLRGKVLKTAVGRSMLELMIERVQRIEYIDEIVVATTVNAVDQPIVDLAAKLEVGCFRGSEEDVLGRVLGAARSVDADVIVELTGDCPLIDPAIATQVIEFYLLHDFDYVSNDHFPVGDELEYPTYPPGIDTQIFSVGALAIADAETTSSFDREHVSPYLFTQSQFNTAMIPAPPNLRRPELSLTLDVESDYFRIRTVYETLYPTNPEFTLSDVISIIDENPSKFESDSNSGSAARSGVKANTPNE